MSWPGVSSLKLLELEATSGPTLVGFNPDICGFNPVCLPIILKCLLSWDGQ